MFETITWLVTNSCGMKCAYCNFRNRPIQEASIVAKKKVLQMMKMWPNSATRFICLLGGDIIYMNKNIDFVKSINDLGLIYGYQSSCADAKSMQEVLPLIRNLSISVDPMSDDWSRYAKGMNGIFWAGRYSGLNKNNDIHATITVDRENIKYVPRTVKILSDLGIWTEITAVHWKKGLFDLVPEKSISKGFDHNDIPMIQDIMGNLIEMKEKGGYKIHSSSKFLSLWEKHAVNLDWKCSQPSNCVVDADLSMRLCLHCPGKRVRKWSVLDLYHAEKWSEFLEDWKKDQEECCPKCFWDCQLEIDPTFNDSENITEATNDWFSHKG